MIGRSVRTTATIGAAAVLLTGCGFTPYDLPLPGGANVGDDPYEVTVDFRDVLDLVPQSAVRVDDIAVGKVTDIQLEGWTATVTLEVNDDVVLPANAEATLRQSGLLGEKFVNLAAPENPSSQRLDDGDHIGLDRSGRNPEIEEVLGAASLLLNGGGLEKTNTIVRELSRTLDGNEPEIKQLLQNAENFIGQLDQNKGDLLVALEKVDNLARTTQDQEGAITAALDELPEALAVLEDQRGELVGLLESLDDLGDVATGVIRRSKEDTLAVLRDLEPTLKGLADAGDDLAKSFEVLLTFPFSDALVGETVQQANRPCPEGLTSADPGAVQDTACYGDYANLDIRLGLDGEQVANLVAGVGSLLGQQASAASTPDASEQPTEADQAEGAETPALVDLVGGLVPVEEDASGTPAPSPETEPGSGSGPGGGGSGFCSLLGMCRTTTASEYMETADDLGRLLVGPAVAR